MVAGSLALGATPASAGFESIPSYDVTLTINEDGTLTVNEVIDYDFGSFPRHGIFRDIPVRFDYPKKADTDRVYEIDVESVKASEGTPADYETEEFDDGGVGFERIKIGDPDRTITGQHTYDITYTVKGALNGFEDHDELYWNAIGQQWSVTIDQADVTVKAPADITKIALLRGSDGFDAAVRGVEQRRRDRTLLGERPLPVQRPDRRRRDPEGRRPGAEADPRGALDARARVRAQPGDRRRGRRPGDPLRRRLPRTVHPAARDRRYKGSAVDQAFVQGSDAPDERTPLFEHSETPVEFVPPDGLRPGQVGTLADFQANPLDVTATIVDLAVRKYLVIEEVGSESRWLGNDWKLTKLKDGGDELKPYERELMDGLFRDGDEVKLSDLKYEFSSRMSEVRKSLMDDAMEQGWFTKRPDGAALGVGCLGLVVLLLGIGVTIALAAFTHAGLLGIPVIILGVVMMVSAHFAPARTAKGSAVFKRVNGFRRFIDESEKERARFAEQKNLFSEYLPYAIVFGATEKWARAFEGLAGEPPDMYWYRSSSPFTYLLLADSIGGFSTTSAGTLTSTPPSSSSGSSGFSSGGGFSGGGGGGGGGGSW